MTGEKPEDPDIEVGASPVLATARRWTSLAFLGHSSATRAVYTQLRAVHGRRGPVLVSGAPGTGKRIIAEMICRYDDANAVVIEHRVDQLSGAGSNAEQHVTGQFIYACPIETLGLGAQAQLLRRFGPAARLVLGTRLEPGSEAWSARLHPSVLTACVQRVRLPSLAARVDDLDQLCTQILLEAPLERPLAGISDEALACLRRHDWPGNRTELEAVLAEAFAAARGFQVELWDLPPRLRLREATVVEEGSAPNPLSLAAAERRAVLEALRQARGNKRKAARMLEVGKTTLYRKLASYGLG